MLGKLMKFVMPNPTGPIKLTGRSKILRPIEKGMGNLVRGATGGKKGAKVQGTMHGPAGKQLNSYLKDL